MGRPPGGSFDFCSCRATNAPAAGRLAAFTTEGVRTMTTNTDCTFVTTTIPFVNGAPHLGHALEFVIADAVVRHRRRLAIDARFQSGTDDNSLKNVRTAEARGVTPAALVAGNAARFRELGRLLNLQLDDFIQTSTDPRHAPAVHRLWRACAEAGDIYKRAYHGLYCVGCEQFFSDGELDGNICPEHAAPLEAVAEENYFFRASRYSERVRRAIHSDALRITPEARKNEVLRLLHSGLRDFSISRTRERAKGWGIEVPGDPEQIVYVWFDALTNYISTLGYADQGSLFQRYWRNCPNRSHIIGKGVLRFHAAYWPAILLSAGLSLPSEILVHGYVTLEGQKIGKSLGNAEDVCELVKRHGSDAFRYYVLRHLHTTLDSDFSERRLIEARNGELADQLGNLLRRTLSLVERYFEGSVPAACQTTAEDQSLITQAQRSWVEQCAAFDRFDLNESVAVALRFIAAANRYIDVQAPWTLGRRGDFARLSTVLYQLVEAVRHAAWLLSPIIPASAETIYGQLGLTPTAPLDSSFALRWGVTEPGSRTTLGTPLFPKEGN
jgi:methionyl-tRNA synthetase